MHGPTRQPMNVDADHILTDLTTRQFVNPHLTVRHTLAASAQQVGFCPRAAAHAVKWLEVESNQSIGRLRRTELVQLARSIHRFWRHATAIETRPAAR